MVKLLLKLGATAAQADMNHVTALHYMVAENNNEALDILLEHDRPAALSILSTAAFRNSGHSTYYWGSHDEDSPLKTAIGKGYQEMVSKLLTLGAKPTIAFDDWIKGYLAKNQHAKNSTPEQNMQQYNNNVVQPIIAAAAKEMGKSIEDLLAHGADANTLEKQAQSVLQHPSNAGFQTAESLLNIVQKKLEALRAYKFGPESKPWKKPETLRDETFYTHGFVEGSYSYWTALRDYQAEKKANTQEHANYQKFLEKKPVQGAKEKQETIRKLTQELEKAEKALIAAGAKTFVDLHPNVAPRRQQPVHQNVYTPTEPPPYHTKLSFQVPDLNETKKTGYITLFEAAWNNDIEFVKDLTLATWTAPTSTDKQAKLLGHVTQNGPNPPLKVAVKDKNGFSPFSIAVLRGHRDLARKIVDICITQYHKEDGLTSRQRWNMLDSGSDDGDSDNGQVLPIFSELVSDKFTVDNLGEVSNIVKSNVLPLQMIEWACSAHRFNEPIDIDKNQSPLLQHALSNNMLPLQRIEYARSARRFNHPIDVDTNQISLLQHAVINNDEQLLKFIVELGAEQQALLAEEEDDQKSYTLSRDVFQKAIKLGRTEMLAYMIETTGVGIPLNELIKTSGIELKMKPKYYQGLTVGGKKRADWAQAPDSQRVVVEDKIPPLLQAAKAGSVQSVEWFMSDAPMRRYKEFAAVNQHDKRIRTLEESGNGFDRTIGKWLSAKSKCFQPSFDEMLIRLQVSSFFTAPSSITPSMNKALPNTLL